jgi:ceramide glucosyltransferase
MLIFLLSVGSLGLITSTVFAVMVVLGARHHLRTRDELERGFTPPLSLLKPLHGSEPDLEANLATFFHQDYPQYEILFCARDEKDAGLAIARRVAANFPNIPARFFATHGQPNYINAKVASLEWMTVEAEHAILVISDSDVRVTPDYLRAVAAPFRDPAVGAMTCLYRGVASGGGLWARLEGVGMSVEMTAGVLVANMLEGMRFVLGPTMAVRRECVSAFGGMGVMGDFCSDDYILGNLVYQQGKTVALSHHTIDHMILNVSLMDSLHHQARWMKSTRFSRPKGHFGTALTFSVPFGLLAFVAALALGGTNPVWPWLGASLLIWSIATRWAIAWAAGRMVVQDRSWFGLLVLYPIRDLMGFGFWAASYLSSQIVWRGKVYDLLPGGRMRAAKSDPW